MNVITFTPTAEQELIRQAGRTTKDNLIIRALAGAAKTSTLVILGRAIQVPIVSIAFNVRIAKEMAERMPGNVTSKTLNGVGHGAWGKTLGRRLVIDKDKIYNICKKLVDDLPGPKKSEGYEIFTDLMQNVRYGKTSGFIPEGFPARGLYESTAEFLSSLDEEPSELMEELLIEASKQSIRMALAGVCDFDDQILMPTCFAGSFDRYPLALLDESQDFSELNHKMLLKVCRDRVVAVGDENQSIYGFRGAHENSMDLLQREFDMKPFYLTTCFRCPESVVKEAHFRTPHMRAAPGAIEGQVRHLGKWGITDVVEDAVILCRNNAPLFKMAITLLKNGRYPELVGADIGKSLLKVMKKLGPTTMSIEDADSYLTQWREAKLAKSRNPGSIIDQYECIKVFFEQTESLGGAMAYAQSLLDRGGMVKLMTIHKAKGLEFPNIYLLDRDLIRTEKSTQEKNLLYVAITRSKDTLTYINTEGFEGV